MRDDHYALLQKDANLMIGEKIKRKRKAAHISLDTLAKTVHLSVQALSKYESGETNVPAYFLYFLSTKMNISLGYFFEDLPSVEEKKEELAVKSSLNILLIEDDPTDEMLFRKAVNQYKHEAIIMSYNNGDEALNYLRTYSTNKGKDTIHLIFLDLNLPRLDGHKILKALKSNAKTKDIPVVVVTNSLNPDDCEKAYQGFCSGYITKCMDVSKYFAKLDRVISYWKSVALP